MLWLDLKYINMLGIRFRNFKRKGEYLFNFSCPLCGDSRTNKRAARGYVYRKGERLNYDCKRCGAGMSVKNLIRQIDPILHKDMQLEYFKPPEREKETFRPKKEHPKPAVVDPFQGLKRVSDLPANHMCRKYVEKRNIPVFQWDDLYYTDTFFAWSGHVLPGRYRVPKDKRDDEPRLVIPFRNRQGKLTGFQGRQLIGKETGSKYIFVAFASDEPLIWGLDKIDIKQNIYVFEGPIDAMFVPNAVACGGGDLVTDILQLDIPHERFVIVYDNEPRKQTTVSKIKKAIMSGFAVCIWPAIEGSDVNEMVQNKIAFGLEKSCRYVFTKIKEGTYSGVAADMALTAWNRTNNEKKK